MDGESIFKRHFYLDSRSLFLFRVALSIASLVCCYQYLVYPQAFLDPNGVVPFGHSHLTDYYWSFFEWIPSFWWRSLLFATTAVLSLLLVFVRDPKWVLLPLLLLHISIENFYSITGGTVGIRMGLFWALFFLGSYSSYSSFRKGVAVKVVSIGTFCFFAQILIFYWAAFFNKNYLDWAITNTALYNFLWWGGVAAPLGQLLREYPDATIWITRCILFLEFIAPILLLSATKHELSRLIACILLLGMHVGIELTMNLEPFPLANIAITLAFLPTSFWSYLRYDSADFAELNLGPRMRIVGLVPIVILFMLVSKHAHHKGIISQRFPPSYSALELLRMNEIWGMFSGGGDHYIFWPVVLGVREDGSKEDVWRRYLGLETSLESKSLFEEPKVVADLYPNLRWQKYLTHITMFRGVFGKYQKSFLGFLCSEMNSNEKSYSRIELHWAWRKVQGVNEFGELEYGLLTEEQCGNI